MRHLACVCLLAVATVGLPSQTTHLVGPGGHGDIGTAIGFAAPGDVILVSPGTYFTFHTTKGVTIRALGAVTVVTSSPGFWSLPPTQTLALDGITFQGPVAVTSGHLTMTGCAVAHTLGSLFGVPAVAVTGGSLHLVDCAVHYTGFLHAIAANGANVTAVGTEVTSGNAGSPAPSLVLTGATFTGSDCRFASTLVADAGSTAWLRDSTIDNPVPTCPLFGAGTFRLDRCALGPTSATVCASTTAGAPLLGVEALAPLQNGTTYTLQFRSAPLQFVAVHASGRLAPTPLSGVFEQPLQLDLAAFWFVGLYATDANGDASASWNLPAGQFVDTSLWLEAIAIEPTFPWQVAPVVGGVVR